MLNIQIERFLFTVHLRWGIGADLESTGGDVPTLMYDTEGGVEPCIYNGWTLRLPFLLFTIGVIYE